MLGHKKQLGPMGLILLGILEEGKWTTEGNNPLLNSLCDVRICRSHFAKMKKGA